MLNAIATPLPLDEDRARPAVCPVCRFLVTHDDLYVAAWELGNHVVNNHPEAVPKLRVICPSLDLPEHLGPFRMSEKTRVLKTTRETVLESIRQRLNDGEISLETAYRGFRQWRGGPDNKHTLQEFTTWMAG